MTRHCLSTIAVAVLVAVVGAQGPTAALPAHQRAELYARNRVVIKQLVERTVESSRTPNAHLKRAGTYYHVLTDFNRAIGEARTDGDNERVEELTQHVKTLIDDGLTPTLKQAQQQKGASDMGEFQKEHDDLLAQLIAMINSLDDKPAAKKSLEDAKARLSEIGATKKK